MRSLSARFSGALGLGLLAFTALACGGQTPAAAPDSQAKSTGPKVQRLVLGINPPVNDTNSASIQVSTSAWTNLPMWEDLFGVTPEGKEIVPMLATEWTLQPDGQSYLIKLQRGVQFHDGKGEFTAKDVQFSLDDLKGETEAVAPAIPRTLNTIAGLDIVNDYEFLLRMRQPDAGLLVAMSQAENIVKMRSKVDSEARTRRPTLEDRPLAGTGPYTYEAHGQAQYLRFKRAFDKHWRQTPDFPEFEFRYIKENSTILAALLSKEIHVAALPPELTPQAEQRGFKTIEGKAPGLHVYATFRGVYLNQKIANDNQINADPNAKHVFPNSPLMDVRVRKALNKAIDREALNKAFLRGRGTPVYNEFFHPTRPGWNAAWERNFKDAYGYDPEAAKKLLVEAGYGPGKAAAVTMILRPYPYFPGLFDMEEAITNHWRAVGIETKIDQSDNATISAKDRQLAYDSHVYGIVTSVRQLAGVATYQSALPGIGGRLGTELPELDAIYGPIRRTLEPKQQDELWRQWGDIAYNQYASIPLFWMPSEAVVDPEIVADYPFPGSISGIYTHVEYIKAK